MNLPTTISSGRLSGSRPPYIAETGRDLRLDIGRGYCVFAMLVDHIGGLSPLQLLTGGGRFFVGAAEGFILISGITAGQVYRKVIDRAGLPAAVRKALRRALDLYLIAVGLTLLIGAAIQGAQLLGIGDLGLGRPLVSVLNVLTLHRTYPVADVMLLYALLMAALPLALVLLATGHTRILLTISAALWLQHQLWPGRVVIPWPIAGNRVFVFAAWQLLFFATFALGYHRDRWPRFVPLQRQRLHVLAGLGVAALMALYVLISLSSDALPAQVQRLAPVNDAARVWIKAHLYSKGDVGIGRVVAAAFTSVFFFLSLTRWWRVLACPLTAVLLPFGQNALYAYTVHVLAVVAAALAFAGSGLTQDDPWLNAAFQSVAIAAIWFLCRRHFLLPGPQQRWRWRLAAVGLVCVAQFAIA